MQNCSKERWIKNYLSLDIHFNLSNKIIEVSISKLKRKYFISQSMIYSLIDVISNVINKPKKMNQTK